MKTIAVVTGATGGLGKSYVYECAKRGYDIVLSATKQERLDALKAEVLAAYPNISVWAKACDLSNDQSRAEFWDFIAKNNIKPNMLINNAGYILEGSFCGCSNEEVTKGILVNCVGTTDFTYKFLKQRNENEQSHIIIVSSLASFYPLPQMSIYSSTKSMLTRLSIALRRELKGKNCYVTAVCPGSMATNQDMKLSIESQGLGGKLSLQSTDKVAKVSLNKVHKNKAKYIPGFFNKLMWLMSKFATETTIANLLYRRWTKCEKKRGQYR